MPDRYEVGRDVSQRRRSSQTAPNTEQPEEEPRKPSNNARAYWFLALAIIVILSAACYFSGIFDAVWYPLDYGNSCNYNRPYGCAGPQPTSASPQTVSNSSTSTPTLENCPAPGAGYVEKYIPEDSGLEVSVADSNSASLIGLFADQKTLRCWLAKNGLKPVNPGPSTIVLEETSTPNITAGDGVARPKGAWALVAYSGAVTVEVVDKNTAETDGSKPKVVWKKNYAQTTMSDTTVN